MSIQDMKLVLSGRFSVPRTQFIQELEAAGVHVIRELSSNTDFLVLGRAPGTRTMGYAKDLGIRTIAEEEIRAMMRGETVELDAVGASGTRSLDELMGEARSLLARDMSLLTWEALVDLLDRCEPDQQEPLVNYIEGNLEGWDDPDVRAHAIQTWARHARDLRFDDEEQVVNTDEGPESERPVRDYEDDDLAYWYARWPERVLRELRTWAMHGDHVRLAPDHWLGEMSQGARSPKYRLIRAMNLRSIRTSSSKFAAMVAHPDLRDVRMIEFDPYKKLTKAHIEALLTRPHFAHIESIAWGGITPATARVVAKHAATISPRVLDVTGCLYFKPIEARESLDPLMGAPLFDQVEHLRMPTNYRNQGNARILHLLTMRDPVCPRLERLELEDGPFSTRWARHAITPLLARISELALHNPRFSLADTSSWQTVATMPLPPSIQTLDIATAIYRARGFSNMLQDVGSMILAPDEAIEEAVAMLCQGAILSHIERVRLGLLRHDARIVEAFTRHRPEIALID